MAEREHQRELRSAMLSEVEADLHGYLRKAEDQEILITDRGKPVGVLIGFASDEEWVDFGAMQDDEAWCARIAQDFGLDVRPYLG